MKLVELNELDGTYVLIPESRYRELRELSEELSRLVGVAPDGGSFDSAVEVEYGACAE